MFSTNEASKRLSLQRCMRKASAPEEHTSTCVKVVGGLSILVARQIGTAKVTLMTAANGSHKVGVQHLIMPALFLHVVARNALRAAGPDHIVAAEMIRSHKDNVPCPPKRIMQVDHSKGAPCEPWSWVWSLPSWATCSGSVQWRCPSRERLSGLRMHIFSQNDQDVTLRYSFLHGDSLASIIHVGRASGG